MISEGLFAHVESTATRVALYYCSQKLHCRCKSLQSTYMGKQATLACRFMERLRKAPIIIIKKLYQLF